jgi:hypothetical protein
LLRFTRRHEAAFFDDVGEPEWRPPTKEQFARLQARIPAIPFDTDSSQIDDALYGGDKP